MEELAVELLRDVWPRTPVGGTTLDLGCGFGAHLSDVTVRDYVGLDISVGLLRFHKWRRRSNTALIASDMLRLPLRGSLHRHRQLGMVLSVLSLNYVRDMAEIIQAVVTPGVAFVIVMPHPEFDARHGRVAGDVVELNLEGTMLRYHVHQAAEIIAALGSPQHILIRDSKPLGAYGSPYIAFAGMW
jgi:SAM-dependent methyltransferase